MNIKILNINEFKNYTKFFISNKNIQILLYNLLFYFYILLYYIHIYFFFPF